MSKNKLILTFLAVSAITTYIYLFDVKAFFNIDMINHFLGGMLLANLIPKNLRIEKSSLIFILASAVFIGWEALEILFTNYNIYPKLFDETISNRIQDVVLDYLGFVVFYKL